MVGAAVLLAQSIAVLAIGGMVVARTIGRRRFLRINYAALAWPQHSILAAGIKRANRQAANPSDPRCATWQHPSRIDRDSENGKPKVT